MRVATRLAALYRHQVKPALLNSARPRISLCSARTFHSYAPIFQGHALAEDNSFEGPPLFQGSDNKGKGQDRSSRQKGQKNRNNFTDRSGGKGRDSKRGNEKAEMDSEIPLEYSAEESELKETESYKPVHWLEYRSKLDPGFLESMKTIFKYKHLTEVQNAIISKMPLQKDILVRSKTGTGKTLGFLIPAIQRHIDYMSENKLSAKQYPKTHTGVLVVVPTRELGQQITMEARRLIHTVLPLGMKCQTLIGGDSKRLQIRRMDRERNDIIVGTPGRLLDFFESEPGVRDMMMSAKTLILDEVDVLLDMGFQQDLQNIIEYLKEGSASRLNMMFSATIDEKVKKIAEGIMHPGFEYLSTVKSTDSDVQDIIQQTYIIQDMNDHLKILLSLIITEQMKRPKGKIIVFFNTTRQVQLYITMFRILRRLYFDEHFQQFDIHSRMAQDKRSKVSHAFRTANVGSVLFTSDVSARGVDYPGVTKVIHMGMPESRTKYIHRIGRTGRAGKGGDSVLVLAPFEKNFLKELHDIPIKDHQLPPSEIEMGPAEMRAYRRALATPPLGMQEETIMSAAGYYLTKTDQLAVSAEQLLDQLADWAVAMGAPRKPRFSQAFVDKILGVRRSRSLLPRLGSQGSHVSSEYPDDQFSYESQARPNVSPHFPWERRGLQDRNPKTNGEGSRWQGRGQKGKKGKSWTY